MSNDAYRDAVSAVLRAIDNAELTCSGGCQCGKCTVCVDNRCECDWCAIREAEDALRELHDEDT